MLAPLFYFSFAADDPPTLAIGATAPDFKLKGVDGKIYSLASFKDAKILVIVFTCNHCPTAQGYEDRMIKLTEDYKSKGIAVVAINPNDPSVIRLDELDFSDLSDSYAEMKTRAKEKYFNFPYLYDGETQTTAKAYGPIATPHVFIFNKARKLRYEGRFDEQPNPYKTITNPDAINAIEALINDKPVPVAQTKVFGCSIKWADKKDEVEKAKEKWAKEPVSIDSIDADSLHALVKNNSDKVRLINVWATWCGPCVSEFSSFVDINRMYRDRDFEFTSISADDTDRKDKALKFLQKEQASNTNYIFNTDDKYKLIDAVDSAWKGNLPYTILVEPGGKIVYRNDGIINDAELKKVIIDDKYIGRYY